MPKRSPQVVDLRALMEERQNQNQQPKPAEPKIQKPSQAFRSQEQPIRQLDTDPLANFELDLGEDYSQELSEYSSSHPISFIPSSQRVRVEEQRPKREWKPLFQMPTLSLPEISLPTITLPTQAQLTAGMQPALAGFMILALGTLSVVPTLQAANQGLRVKDNLSLQVAASQKLLTSESEGIPGVSQNLLAVSEGFAGTSSELDDLQGNLDTLVKLLPGLSLVNDGEVLTQSVADLTSLTSEFLAAAEPFIESEVDPFDPEAEASLVDSVKNLQDITGRIRERLIVLDRELSAVESWMIPGEQGAQLRQAKEALPLVLTALEDSDRYFDLFLTFVGYDFSRRYLFIFQNNQELRATGGFIGSFGLMNLDRGVVESLDIREIYSPDGQLTKQILAPTPLQELTPRWFLRDSNWFADFPTSAERIMWFYEKTGGPTPDGVISLTPTMIERLLRITGPIELEEYDVTVTADNFIRTTQYQTVTENALDAEKPKQFIDDLAPVLISRILSVERDQYQEVFDAIQNSFQEKHVLLYFIDPELQEIVEQLNLSGELYETSRDYLSVVHTNIGGFKTDGVIEDDVRVTTRIESDGRVINRVEVSRNHKGGNTEYEWWNVPNINYMRFYVPEGSTILGADGFEPREDTKLSENVASFDKDPILRELEDTRQRFEDLNVDQTVESGKTVFGGWKSTAVQDTSNVWIEYELPFRLTNRDLYSMIVQKQSGSVGSRYQHTVELDPSYRVDWRECSDLWDCGELSVTDGLLRRDQFMGMIIEK